MASPPIGPGQNPPPPQPPPPSLPPTRKLYVSSSTGDDANSGNSPAFPKATWMAAIALVRDQAQYEVLGKRGDVWDENLTWATSGIDSGRRQRLGAYGPPGARPRIRSGVSHGLTLIALVEHFQVDGINFIGHTYDGSSGAPAGIKLAEKANDINIIDCYIENYADGIRADPPVGIGSQVNNLEVEYTVIADIYAQAANPANGIYLARCENTYIWGVTISKVGEVDPGPNHNGIYIRGGQTYGCGTHAVVSCNIFEVAGYGLRTNAKKYGYYADTVFAKTAIAAAFKGQDPVNPFAGGMTVMNMHNCAITLGRDCGLLPRGWGVVMEHVYDPADPADPSLDVSRILYLDSGTSTDPHPLVIHPEWPNKNGSGVKKVHWVDSVAWEWQGSIDLNDDDTNQNTLVEFATLSIWSSASDHYLFDHNLNNGLHFSCFNSHINNNKSAPAQYRYNGSDENQSQWKAHLHQPTQFIDKVIPTFTDDTVSLASYDTVVGGNGTFDDLVTLLRAQSLANWRPELEGEAIMRYLFDGFDLG